MSLIRIVRRDTKSDFSHTKTSLLTTQPSTSPRRVLSLPSPIVRYVRDERILSSSSGTPANPVEVAADLGGHLRVK